MDCAREKKPLLDYHHQIPEAIVVDEILPRLPVKSLSRFKCVSKSWLCLIESDRFIKTQLRNSTQSPSYSAWRVVFNHESGSKQCSMRSYLDEESPNISPIIEYDPTIDSEMAKAYLMGSCNGVLCLVNYQDGIFFLWNPVTRDHIKLPRIESSTPKLGFGWDEWSRAFKVFALVRSDDEKERLIGRVYSSETESWKETVGYGSTSLQCGTGKFACGRIHWLAKSWDRVEFFDLRREVFGMIEFPEVGICLWMWELKGCLGVIFDCYTRYIVDGDEDFGDYERRRRVWVMEEEEEEELWVEVVKEPWVDLITEPDKRIVGCRGGFFWVESLVSPRTKTRTKIST